MAEGVVSFLLPKLGTLLTEEYKLIEGLQREVRDIQDELGSMRAFLRIAEAKQDAGDLNDEQREWVKQVLEVAFETEDAVDEFLLCFPLHRDAGCFGHILGMFPFVEKFLLCFPLQEDAGFFGHILGIVKKLATTHQISAKIRDIKYRMEQISARHQRYKSINEGIADTSSRRISEHPIRGHALLLREADLVGIDRPKREIISLILTKESHLKAISVVGMGGLGKTTLVKRVYEAPQVKREFSIHAWLTISQTFIIKDGLKELINQLFKEVKQPIPGDVDSMDIDGLRASVNAFLKDKRYIVVLDDLWKLEHWDSIKYVFPDNCGGRIIITTRIKDLAKTCCHEFRGNVHEMQPLSDDDSWQLFCRTTFREGECPSHLVKISRNIMNKCEGLPLGIVAIGGLLASKDSQEWEIVSRSLDGELEGSGKLDPVRKILLLSYNDLPYYLKCCLLYMGMFPEDAIVYAYDLNYLWMAKGFVEARQGMTTLEVAQSYLNDLVSRSLIHVVDTQPDGKIKSCRVHDLTYKIILSKCKEYNILQAASTPNTVQLENARRLVIDESTFPKEHVHLLHLRSIKSHSSISDSSLSKLLKGTSKLLKVLYLASSNLNIIPKEVFKLSNLTYLNLASTNVTFIPGSIRKLQNLEYLFLDGTKVRELPADIIMLKKLYLLWIGMNFLYDFDDDSIWGCRAPSGFGELGSLHHLSFDDYSIWGCRAPSGFGALVSLHHLSYIEADSENVIQEIGKLTQLRTLGITKVKGENGRALCSSLEKLTNLQVLSIQGKIRDEIFDLDDSSLSNLQFLHQLTFVGRLQKFPNWVPSCHGLSTLALVHSCLIENPLGCLEVMPNLVDLRLIDAYKGDTLNFKAGGFQKLKRLLLCELNGLKLMTFEKGTLPELETLSIANCKLIEELPKGIQYLAKLQTLTLVFMPSRLGNSLRNLNKKRNLNKESDGYQKIAHIGEIEKRNLNKENDDYQKIAHIGEIKIEGFVNGKWETEYVKW